jgi:diaminopimelate decarboxylase
MTINEGRYFIQNQDILELCQSYGTPLYVYDGAKIEEKVNALKNAFVGVDMKIKYACKANTNISLLKLMNKLGVEIDVVSPQEMAIALKAGFSPDKITYTSSGVSFDEIEECVAQNVSINIDNLSSLEKFGRKYGNSVPVLIRIRPNIEGGGNAKISTGHKESKFGIAIEQKAKILELVEKYNLNIVGIHQHTGSDIKDGKTFVSVAEVIYDFAMDFPNLKYLDFGGGFKVAYKDGDIVTDMKDLGEKLSASFLEFCKKYGKDLQLWFEPGKFLVSESGFLLAQVNVVKENPTKTLLGLNTGLNHLIRPMMYDAFHDVLNISKPADALKKTYDVVGYICETDDIAKERQLPEAEEGDILAIKNAGAYGFTMASNYNARFRPAEVLIYENKAHLVRKRETLQDLLTNQVLVDF